MSGSPRLGRAGFVAMALGPPWRARLPSSASPSECAAAGKAECRPLPTRSSGSLHSLGPLVLRCRRASWSRQSGQSPTRITRK
ncbi:hypothetical protein PF002_g22081 [Phytophthora fragariae]|uniref:Uncharacterized protein n=1 Tax=Phytophthora fragariae TaxID=53985 RepID=A0A6A3XCH9_9STRA|nr:hypothetical protein PF002_g22081 [Phytophthora fragariae]KAE9203914.1 hypothetical protein PF004_g17992 [Phytophthora fragariae]